MADDSAHRSNDPYRQAVEPPRPRDSDPLAELARLIGQSDPFAEFGRSSQRHSLPRSNAHAQRDRGPPPARDERRPDRPREQHGADYFLDGHRPDHASREDSGRPPAHERPPDAWRSDYRSYGDAPIDYHARENERAEHYPDNRVHDRWHDDDPGHAGEADHYQLDDVPLEPHEDEMYDDAPRKRHHGGLVTALALVGCAMLGTASAYGFRSYYVHPNAAQPPPVITADSSTPTKIVPATVDASQSSAIGQDRSANGGREPDLVPESLISEMQERFVANYGQPVDGGA